MYLCELKAENINSLLLLLSVLLPANFASPANMAVDKKDFYQCCKAADSVIKLVKKPLQAKVCFVDISMTKIITKVYKNPFLCIEMFNLT